MTHRPGFLLLLTLFGAAGGVAAQDPELARGITAAANHDLVQASRLFAAVLARDSTSYEANWRLAIALVDMGKQTPDAEKSRARDTLYAKAVSYARRAVAAKANGSEGHFALAVALGHTALTLGTRARIRLAAVIRDEALETLRLEPRHEGAAHLLGRWNAEIMRLPVIEKFFAKAFLGAAVFNEASWESAERYMRLAVQSNPNRIVHRLDLAAVLADRSKPVEAMAQIDTLLTLPVEDAADAANKRQGRVLAAKIAKKFHP